MTNIRDQIRRLQRDLGGALLAICDDDMDGAALQLKRFGRKLKDIIEPRLATRLP